MEGGDLSNSVAPSIIWVAEDLVFHPPTEPPLRYTWWQRRQKWGRVLDEWVADEYVRKLVWDVAVRFDVQQYLATYNRGWLRPLRRRIEEENLPFASVIVASSGRALANRPDVAMILDSDRTRVLQDYGRKGFFCDPGTTYHPMSMF